MTSREQTSIVDFRPIFPPESTTSKNRPPKTVDAHASFQAKGKNYAVMSTENQIEANRRNAQLCTGPKTQEGKARSSQNALKTGLHSQKEVIATESQEEYDALAADFHNHYAPANPHERSLVDALVRYEWLSRRYMAADTALWNFSLVDNKTEHGKAFMYHAENLSRAGRYFNNARRGYAATMKELEAAQAARKPIPSRDFKGAVTQPPATEPAPNQPPAPKLVSFRQPESPLPAEPDQTQPTPEIPPIAA